MDQQRVRELVALLPPGATYPALPRYSPFRPARLEPAERLARAMTDPAFGASFVGAFIEKRRWLPDIIIEWPLLQFFLSRAFKVAEPLMMEVETFLTEARRHDRDFLDALLLADDASLADIAELLNTKVEIIEAYETLHWNVRDRMHEKRYLAALLYPEGRQAAARDAKPDAAGDRLRLLRAGAENGKAAVLVLAGWSPETSGAIEDARARFDHQLQTEAGHGWSAGLRLDDLVIRAAHQGSLRRQENASDDDPLALHHMNAVSPALDEIRKHNGLKGEPRPDYRVSMEKVHAEVEAMLNITRRGRVPAEDA